MTPIMLSRLRHEILVDCLARQAEPTVLGTHFTLYRARPRRKGPRAYSHLNDCVLVHDFSPAEIDNNIGRHVVDELLPFVVAAQPTGNVDDEPVNEQHLFERLVGEVVRSIDGNERRAWRLFYDNTLMALRRAGNGESGRAPANTPPQDFIGNFAAIYRRVADLVAAVAPASILDAATCFGFLPILLAAGAWSSAIGSGPVQRVVACDVNEALLSLGADYARHNRLTDISFVRADIVAPNLAEELSATGPFDVVTAVHVFEHLTPAETVAALSALWSLTARRLIITVPIEAIPDPRFGHCQTFDCARLRTLGERTGAQCRTFEDHGAWLVLDRAGHSDH